MRLTLPPTHSWLRMLITLLGLTASALMAEDASTIREEPRMYWAGVGIALPTVRLPAQVVAPAGKLSLYADYASADSSGVPIYVVNRTDAMVAFDSQDNDIYAKLERRLGDGSWERAQPHIASDCGNSYFAVFLPPSRYFEFRGYAASHGTKETVRYSLYGHRELYSNEGQGLVAPDDVEKARLDRMSLWRIPLTLVKMLDREIGNDQQIPLGTRVAALRLLQSYQDSYALKSQTTKFLEQELKPSKDTEGKRRAAEIIQTVLASPWPKVPSPDALFQRCQKALESVPPKASSFGEPEADPGLVWSVLADLAETAFGQNPTSPGIVSLAKPNLWKPVVMRIKAALQATSGATQLPIARLLAVPALIDETLSNDEVEDILRIGGNGVLSACANILFGRREVARLVRIGKSLPPEGQLSVFTALACPPRSHGAAQAPREPMSEEESEFWAHCLTEQTLRAVNNLVIYGHGELKSYGEIVRQPLREFLLQEIQRSNRASHDFSLPTDGYLMRLAVESLAQLHRNDDIPIFEGLLRYRGFEKSESYRGSNNEKTVSQLYSVRAAARTALLQMAVPVPDALETEKVISGPNAR